MTVYVTTLLNPSTAVSDDTICVVLTTSRPSNFFDGLTVAYRAYLENTASRTTFALQWNFSPCDDDITVGSFLGSATAIIPHPIPSIRRTVVAERVWRRWRFRDFHVLAFFTVFLATRIHITTKDLHCQCTRKTAGGEHRVVPLPSLLHRLPIPIHQRPFATHSNILGVCSLRAWTPARTAGAERNGGTFFLQSL